MRLGPSRAALTRYGGEGGADTGDIASIVIAACLAQNLAAVAARWQPGRAQALWSQVGIIREDLAGNVGRRGGCSIEQRDTARLSMDIVGELRQVGGAAAIIA